MLYLSEYIRETSPEKRKENRKTEHELGLRLLEEGLLLEYGRSWDIAVEEGGKPYLLGAERVHFNISHSRGIVICGISNREIGVDVERIRPYKESVVRRVCSETECRYVMETTDESERARRFCRLWTLKESYIKAIGKGLAFPLQEICFDGICQKDEKEGMGELSHEKRELEPIENHISSSIPGWKFQQYQYGAEYYVATCEKM